MQITYEDILAEKNKRKQITNQQSGKGISSSVGSFLRGAADAASLGFGDEITAAALSPILKLTRPDLFGDQSTSQVYNDALDTVRTQQKQSAQSNPYANLGGMLLGGVGLPFKANNLKQAAGLAAGYGAGYGLGSSERESVSDAALDTAKGAGLGALGGTAGYGLVSGIQKYVPGLLDSAQDAFSNTGALIKRLLNNDQALETTAPTLKNMNNNTTTPRAPYTEVSPSPTMKNPQPTITKPTTSSTNVETNSPKNDSLDNYMLTPEQKRAIELSREFNIPLRFGQAARYPAAQAQDDLIMSGKYGYENALKARTEKQFQDDTFNNVVRGQRDTLGGGQFVEQGSSIEPAIQKIQQQAMNEREQIRNAYQNATKGQNVLSAEALGKFNSSALANLNKQGIYPANTERTFGELKAFNNILKNKKEIDFNEIEAWRQGLNQSIQSAKGRDISGLNSIKSQFDDFLDNTIEQALLKGDTNVLNKFKEARQLNSEWKQKYNTQNPDEYGKKFIQDIIENSQSREPYTNQMIVNKMLGSSDLGFTPQTVNIANEMGRILGRDSKEFAGLKMEAANKVLKPLLNERGEFSVRNPSVETYKRNLERYEPVLKSIFNPNELKQLKDLGDLATIMYQQDRSKFNPSQSGVLLMLSKSLKNIPIVNNLLDIAQKAKDIRVGNKSLGLSEMDLIKELEKLNKNVDPKNLTVINQALQKKYNTLPPSAISKALSISSASTQNNNTQNKPQLSVTKEDILAEIKRRKGGR